MPTLPSGCGGRAAGTSVTTSAYLRAVPSAAAVTAAAHTRLSAAWSSASATACWQYATATIAHSAQKHVGPSSDVRPTFANDQRSKPCAEPRASPTKNTGPSTTSPIAAEKRHALSANFWKSRYARPSTPVVESTCSSSSVSRRYVHSHAPARPSSWSGRALQKNCGHDERKQK